MSNLLKNSINCDKKDASGCSAVKLMLDSKEKDLGGFSVRRFLPSKELGHIGPFIFFDHLGPAAFPPGEGIDVRPHPHIGLATITYVFAGEILHRDNLGHVQVIRPNEINWMTAGHGIVHSERTDSSLRAQGHTLEALQLWVALPEEYEQTDPFFIHYAENKLPLVRGDGFKARVMIGEAFAVRSPVKIHSPTLYVEVNLDPKGRMVLPEGSPERGVYVLSGEVQVAGITIPQHTMALFDGTPGIEFTTEKRTRLVIIGGEPLGHRTVWWNLVSSRKELIEKAKRDWKAGNFPKVPGETEYIPLPE